MPDIIGQETWTADGKDYVVSVTEPGATVTENAISIISPVRLRKGDINYDPLEPHIESQIRSTIRDTSKLFSTAIEGKQVGDIVLEFTEDGSTLFKGFVVPEYARSLIYKGNPEFVLSAFDGVSLLKGIDYDQGGYQTVRDQIYNIANKIGLSLITNIFFEDKEDGADASTEAPDALRFRMESLLEKGGSYYDALIALCEYYNAQFFQRGGEWFFMQRALRGASMTKHSVNSAGATQTKATVDYIYQVFDSTLHRERSFASVWPAKSRIESVHKYVETGLRNGDFSQGQRHWSGISEENALGRLMDDVSTDYLEQEVGTTFRQTAVTNRDRVNLTYTFTAAIDAAATGSGDIEFGTFKFIDLAGNERWLDTTGGWNSSETMLTANVANLALPGIAGNSVEFTASFTSANLPFDPMGGILRLIYEPIINGNPWITEIIHTEYEINHIRPEDDEEPPRPAEQVYGQETGNLGEIESHEFVIGDGTDDHIAPGVMQYYDGTDWNVTTDWDGSGQKYHEKRMIARHDQLDERLKTLELSHKYGEDPDLHNAITYNDDVDSFADVYIPTFIEKIYERNAKVWTRSASKQLLDASALVTQPATHIYFANAKKIKKAAITTSGTYTIETLNPAITTGRSIDQIRADEAGGYIFCKENVDSSSDNRYLVRYNLSGGDQLDIASWLGSTYKLGSFCLARNAEKIYCMEVLIVGNGYQVTRRAYDGTLEAVLFNDSSHVAGALGQGIGISDDETKIYWRSKSGSNDNFYEHDIAAVTQSDIYDFTRNDGIGIDNGHDEYYVDTAYGQFFCNVRILLLNVPHPAAGSETTITGPAPSTNSLAVDRARQKLYVVEGAGGEDIQIADYDGSNTSIVLTDSEAVKSIDLGFS